MPALDLTPVELATMRAQERAGEPYLAYRDGGGTLQLLALTGYDRVAVGRSAESDLSLSWDTAVSRAHALLERVGGEWTAIDDGISRNGSQVNGSRIVGRRRLTDGDVLTFGGTRIQFRRPTEESILDPSAETSDVAGVPSIRDLRPAQRRVLIALCRPLLGGRAGAIPASNQEIAGELCISLDGVRTQMRTLYECFDVPELPQARKRATLAGMALEAGIVTRADLVSGQST